MFEIELTHDAFGDLSLFKRYEKGQIVSGIEKKLVDSPDSETRNRKRLRPNSLAEWELRIDRFRVFYDIDMPSRIVKIVAVGYKDRNRLYIRGKEYTL